MTTTMPFGPQLIGQTEKALQALLLRLLEGTGLDEPRWVTLRVAGMLEGNVTADGLAAAVSERAHVLDAPALVGDLTSRGLLADGRLTEAGRALAAQVQADITAATAPIWTDLPAEDVAAAARVLAEVATRVRALLS